MNTRVGEDNADAHLKRQVMGREVVVAITEGKLDFGPWEQIFYGEFDGRRRKRVLVKIIGGMMFTFLVRCRNEKGRFCFIS
jgi:secondary thiamine-phosphate synthase enzyme